MIRDITLKYKLILGSMAAVFVPFMVTGIIIYFQLTASLLELSQEKSLHIAEGIADYVDATLLQEIRLAESIATDADIITALKTNDSELAYTTLNSAYERIGENWDTIFTADKHGISGADFSSPVGTKLDISDRQYFINAKNGEANVFGPLESRGPVEGQQIFMITAPVRENNDFLGVICIPHAIDYLADLVSRKTLGNTGYAFLVNTDGIFLTHPQTDYIMVQLTPDNVLTAVIQSGEANFVTYELEGSERVAGVTFMKLTGWAVIFAQDTDEIMAPARKILFTVFLGAMVFCILAAGLLIIFSGKISTPIQRTMEMMKHLTQHANELVLQIGPDRKIVFASPSYEKITGLKTQSVIGTELDLKRAINSSEETIWNLLESGAPWSGRITMQGCENSSVTLETILISLRGNNVNEGYLLIGRNITNDLFIEKKLQQSQKMEALGTLAGGIAHDFNNILGGIYGYAQLSLMEEKHADETEEYLQEILRASERARDLVSQILTFSRQTEIELRPLQPTAIVKETLKLLRASIPATIEIESNIASDSYILAEPTQMHQIIMNLFTNAIHAIGDNTGTIKLDMEDFLVSDEFARTHPDLQPGNHINLRVTDTGCGIEPDILEHIFEPFFTTKPNGKGTGLGLSVVHGIARRMGGTITAYSEIGRGTVFNVIIPCIEHDATKRQQTEQTIREGNERIAIIDDEPAIATTMASILANLGYRVTAFTDSSEALDILKSKPDEFDIIITDYSMPHVTGLDITRVLTEADIDVPIILMSGYLTKNIESSIRKAGVSKIVSKPINTYQLTDAIRSVMQKDG